MQNKTMITKEFYAYLLNEFYKYVAEFQENSDFIQQSIKMKVEHTLRVVDLAKQIALGLKLDENQVQIAQTIALLHDIGRFEQVLKYNTFNDSKSIDHAGLSNTIIIEKEWLNNLNDNTKKLIFFAIENHNKLVISKCNNDDELLHAKIIRDADKIDIYHVAIKIYNSNDNKRIKSFAIDLSEKPAITQSVVKTIVNGSLPKKDDLFTINDFKLMQLAYVFDVNFKISYSIINQQQYVTQIFNTLPKSDLVFDAYRRVKIHIENMLLSK